MYGTGRQERMRPSYVERDAYEQNCMPTVEL